MLKGLKTNPGKHQYFMGVGGVREQREELEQSVRSECGVLVKMAVAQVNTALASSLPGDTVLSEAAQGECEDDSCQCPSPERVPAGS